MHRMRPAPSHPAAPTPAGDMMRGNAISLHPGAAFGVQ